MNFWHTLHFCLNLPFSYHNHHLSRFASLSPHLSVWQAFDGFLPMQLPTFSNLPFSWKSPIVNMPLIAGYTPKTPYKPFLFSLGRLKKIEKGLYGVSKHNWATISETICPDREMLFFFLAIRRLGHCSFRISWQIPWFQKFHFYDVTL